MASWDGIAVELLRKATRVDADVQFRSFTLQQQCEKLRTICQYFRNQELTLVKEKTAQQVETNAVEQSIQEAIQRARKVRAEMAAGRNEGEASGEEEEDELEKETQLDAEEQKLQDILTAKKMLRLLNSEAKALMERAPHSPPKLSLAAATHRDAMLSRIRRKKPQTSVGVVDNAILLSAARKTQTQLHDDTELWEKLQAAWVARVFTASEKVRAEPLPDAYSTTVREIVLTELSNAVLWSFKTHFTENLELDPLEMQSVMGLVRLSQAQMQRSSPMNKKRSLEDLQHALREEAEWKDSNRFAQFVANVVGGIVVVLGLGSYLLNLVLVKLADAPAHLDEYVSYCQGVVEALMNEALVEFWTVVQSLRNSKHHDFSDPQVVARPLAVALFIGAALLLARKYKWVGWFCGLQLVVILQWVIALYQMARIVVSLTFYVTVKVLKQVLWIVRTVYASMFLVRDKQAEALRRLMKTTKSYREWKQMAQYLDVLEGKNNWKTTLSPEDTEHCDFVQMRRNVETLTRALDAGENMNVDELRYIVASVVMRDELGVDSPSLHLECNSGTKTAITKYNVLVIRALDTLADLSDDKFPHAEKVRFFRRIKQSFGSTALCLSGGGAIAMYHMGVMRALLEADVLPNVISGSSGGSITAAFAACRTNEELLNDVFVNDISTRYFSLNIRWFPPLLEQLAHCVKTGFLVASSEFEHTTEHYYSEPMNAEEKTMYYTFQDAFMKTGRHVCITVSASDITGHKGPKKLLLSHINTPHVLLWSAVAVSCSLPGIMKGKQLMARDFQGNIVPYASLNKEWVDGSIQHDLPMETMASGFDVTNFIVSQVNPHVVPFVGDEVDKPNFRKSLFHKLESVIAGDVRHRLKMLAFLGLFPKIYGHQFSSYFKQNFSGNVTIIPDFRFLESIGIKAILNPTVQDMTQYIEGGQRAVWPKLAYIRHLCSIEKCLDHHLEQMLGTSAYSYTNWLHPGPTTKGGDATKTNKTKPT
ncbi:hypothetical protein BBO99_00003827 [Phytophthora kernoviae]|uniref:PNPLA domain-containing protein n=1 Tax=Phytophthora kernoviae TaxID=325452 RepID=A0A421GSY3_9STRA|nr:hypothetical protein BBO99_00003827 [Phytophthora kernoviae]